MMRSLLSLLLLVLALGACSDLTSGGGASGPFRVEYRISGTARSVDLTYQNASGSTEQQDDVRLPFSLTFDAPEGQYLYISAQNTGEGGTVTCQLLLDGTEQKTATSSGDYVIASCSGRFKR